MKVSRMKTWFMDFALRQNESGNREPIKIIGEERERVTHFKCLGTSTEEKRCMETEITVRMGLARLDKWEEMQGSIVGRGMPAKLIRPVMLWSRNVGYNEETRTWD